MVMAYNNNNQSYNNNRTITNNNNSNSNKKFWKNLIENDGTTTSLRTSHLLLPMNIQKEIDYIKSNNKFKSKRHVLEFLDYFTKELSIDIDFWLLIIQSGYGTVELFINYADENIILNNRYVMLYAIRYNYRIYDILQAPLNEDYELVSIALQQNIKTIIYIPYFIQLMYPNLIANAMIQSQSYNNNNKNNHKKNTNITEWLEEYIANELWTNRNIVLAWIQIGGRYLYKRFHNKFRYDKELFLNLIKNNNNNNYNDFIHAAELLRNDKNYMMNAVMVNGLILQYTTSNIIKYDFDIVLMAFNNCPRLLKDLYDPNNKKKAVSNRMLLHDVDIHFLKRFANYIQIKVDEYNNFIQIITYIKTTTNNTTTTSVDCSSPILLLNQGQETINILYQKYIKEYLGINPDENYLNRLYNAQKNLQDWRLL